MLVGERPDSTSPMVRMDHAFTFHRSHGKGSLTNPALVPEGFSFEGSINQIHGEDKKMFIEFVKRMIKWSPHERSTAWELFKDPWLYADFPTD